MTRKRKSRAIALSGPPTGITADNYAARAKAFIDANDGQGFMVALKDGQLRGLQFRATPRQYGAWTAFFKRKKIDQTAMKDWPCWMVPAPWPHQFTTDASEAEDLAAGDAFARKRFDDDLKSLDKRRPAAPRPSHEPFRPFPKLWEFFADDPQAIMMLDKGLPFELVRRLSRDMAMGVAREILRDRLRDIFQAEEEKWAKAGKRGKTETEWCFPYKPPPFDISDFPDAKTKEEK